MIKPGIVLIFTQFFSKPMRYVDNIQQFTFFIQNHEAHAKKIFGATVRVP